MKKIITILLITSLMLSLAACGASQPESSATSDQSGSQPAQTTENTSSPQETEPAGSKPAEPEETNTASECKTLVIYFSRTGEQYTVGVIDKGNTAIVAEMIAEQTGADLFEIMPEDDHYPMTYAELTDVAKKEQNDKARPGYTGEFPDLSQYDTIFIGAPVWWGDWPMIMYTVFESNDFSGKNLVPFSTHEGSGLSGFDKKLASSIPDATVLTGQAFRGNDCQNKQEAVRTSVNEWLAKLGF